MGVCCASKRCEIQPVSRDANVSSINQLLFPRTARLHILCKDERQRVITDERLQVTLTEPAVAFSQQIGMGKWHAWASGEL